MSDQVEQQEERGDFQDGPLSAGETGHETVDAVLRSMEGLEDRPVEEHVAVFESAHENLRAALADAGDRPGGPGPR